MMLQCSTRVPQKPTQGHENDSNKGKVANISSVGVTTAPPVGPSLPRGRALEGTARPVDDHWLGGLLHNPEEQGKGKQARGGGGGAAAHTR